MGFGFVRISTRPSRHRETYVKLTKIAEVHEVHEFDNELFAKIYADDIDHFDDTMHNKIKNIYGVLATKAYLTKDLEDKA